MVDIRLSSFSSDFVVLHFGGPHSEVDAKTLSSVLKSFSALSYCIGTSIDPASKMELVVVSDGSGSFRVLIKRAGKELAGLLSRGIEAAFWGVVATVIYNSTLGVGEKPNIIINTDEVIISHGADRIIVSRKVHADATNAAKLPKVQSAISETFDALAADTKISDFGLTPRMTDRKPLIHIPRSEFPTSIVGILTTDGATTRYQTKRATLVIRKAWLNGSKRKWSFEWNGTPISAKIADQTFLNKIVNREHLRSHPTWAALAVS
jgi:hypothetical protein